MSEAPFVLVVITRTPNNEESEDKYEKGQKQFAPPFLIAQSASSGTKTSLKQKKERINLFS